MLGIGIDHTHLIWIAVCIGFNVIIFLTVRNISIRLVEDAEMSRKLKKVWVELGHINIAIWLLVLVGLLLFFGTKRCTTHEDMGAANTLNEIVEHHLPLPSEIEGINIDVSREKEILLRKEVEEEQKESSKDYENFLKKTLENIKKE